jgi:hypothetical protein
MNELGKNELRKELMKEFQEGDSLAAISSLAKEEMRAGRRPYVA